MARSIIPSSFFFWPYLIYDAPILLEDCSLSFIIFFFQLSALGGGRVSKFDRVTPQTKYTVHQMIVLMFGGEGWRIIECSLLSPHGKLLTRKEVVFPQFNLDPKYSKKGLLFRMISNKNSDFHG